MVIFRKKYRHDKQRLDEACGLNGAEVLELFGGDVEDEEPSYIM